MNYCFRNSDNFAIRTMPLMINKRGSCTEALFFPICSTFSTPSNHLTRLTYSSQADTLSHQPQQNCSHNKPQRGKTGTEGFRRFLYGRCQINEAKISLNHHQHWSTCTSINFTIISRQFIHSEALECQMLWD